MILPTHTPQTYGAFLTAYNAVMRRVQELQAPDEAALAGILADTVPAANVARIGGEDAARRIAGDARHFMLRLHPTSYAVCRLAAGGEREDPAAWLPLTDERQARPEDAFENAVHIEWQAKFEPAAGNYGSGDILRVLAISGGRQRHLTPDEWDRVHESSRHLDRWHELHRVFAVSVPWGTPEGRATMYVTAATRQEAQEAAASTWGG